jgi:hypothetical protein
VGLHYEHDPLVDLAKLMVDTPDEVADFDEFEGMRLTLNICNNGE